MPETIELTTEPTQDYFLAFMRGTLRFSEDQIEANRRHNGRLFLTPAVVIGHIRGETPTDVKGGADLVIGLLTTASRTFINNTVERVSLLNGFFRGFLQRVWRANLTGHSRQI